MLWNSFVKIDQYLYLVLFLLLLTGGAERPPVSSAGQTGNHQ